MVKDQTRDHNQRPIQFLRKFRRMLTKANFGAGTMVPEPENWNAEHVGTLSGLPVRVKPPEALEHRGKIEFCESARASTLREPDDPNQGAEVVYCKPPAANPAGPLKRSKAPASW